MEKEEDASQKKEEEHKPRFSIEKDKINDLPIGSFGGKISVITPYSSHDKVAHAVRMLGGSRVLGFDTETKPSYRKGESHPIALLQLATERHAFLFRVHGAGIPAGLKRVLENPRILKIGQGLKHELRLLRKELGVQGRGFVDMLDIAHKLDCVPKSVRGLSAIFLGFRVTKSAQRTNWERKKLTDKQLKYAATDAWACLMVYLEMGRRGLIDPRWKMTHK
jgi:ribonuclease D